MSTTRASVTAAHQHQGGYVPLVLVAAGAAWLWLLLARRGMGASPGAMGVGAAAFLGMWALMMAAMMLPATAPIASMYARTLRRHRLPRMGTFLIGYVLVWGAVGLVAYGLAIGAGRVAGDRPHVGTAVAAAVFAVNGAYQLSPWKERCLAVCRAPLGLLLRYGSWRGRTRDLRAGAHHGLFCLGCCWALMVLLGAFGVMNLWAMVGLTAVVTVEKLAPVGPAFARLIGVASLALAAFVFFVPALAPGLTGGPAPMPAM